MNAFMVLRQGIRNILPPAIFLFLTGYFIWNTLNGAHGVKAYQSQLKLRDQAELALHDAHQEQDIWHRRVAALGENALDSDMLDERSRAMLNSAQEGDIIVPYGEHDRLY
ncbi:septation inhibitor protein [Saccharibacter sp. 17.LH.SD]|uniref:FtsB family cell division protein n=1 Tax=Saccharibacter sp. 17.LH.SD TaxID=2689393 RepID=UPI0013697F32|nr:septation inhibitor protein [Saccharibacter sp. 17.LH.SD]MXV44240.1 septation inhibitor protein [Saccharibacter sp. 17.LH.SD]